MTGISTRTEEGAREDAIALLDKFNKLTMEDAIRAAVSAEMRFRAAEARAATAEAEVERLTYLLKEATVIAECRVSAASDAEYWADHAKAAEATASALRDRVAVLEETLKPFAEEADGLQDHEHGHLWESPQAMNLTADHLRAARATLEGASDD